MQRADSNEWGKRERDANLDALFIVQDRKAVEQEYTKRKEKKKSRTRIVVQHDSNQDWFS